MKKTILLITTFALLLSCVSKKITTTTEKESYSLNSVDSLATESKEVNSYIEKQKDTVSIKETITEKEEKVIIKAQKSTTNLGNPCDEYGNLKNINQSSESESFKSEIKMINNELILVSEQKHDLESITKTTLIENERLENKIIDIKSKHSQEITLMKTKLLEIKEAIKEYKSKEATKAIWGTITRVSLFINLLFIIATLVVIRNKTGI